MNIRPLHDRVVVRRMAEERTSAGGTLIPDSATEKTHSGVRKAIRMPGGGMGDMDY